MLVDAAAVVGVPIPVVAVSSNAVNQPDAPPPMPAVVSSSPPFDDKPKSAARRCMPSGPDMEVMLVPPSVFVVVGVPKSPSKPKKGDVSASIVLLVVASFPINKN